MSGIVGVVFGHARPDLSSLLDSMSTSLKHRGGKEGRLVIDDRIAVAIRSDPHAGFRTYLSDDPDFVTIVDGWLTNVDELRRRYRVGDADNCAAVVCAGYRAEGTEVLKRLKGSYALAIVHRDGSDKLLLARDLFASRPLYYAAQNGNFWFGTEIKAILQDPSFKREISRDAFTEILAYGTSVGPRMSFRDMWKVIPGQYVLGAPRRGFRAEWFCTSEDPQARARDDEDWADDIWETLLETVDRQIRRCPASAVLLSGGVDSSLIALALAKINGARSSAISFGSPGWDNDETQYAEDIASRCGLGIEPILIHADDGILAALSGAIWKLEEPTRFYNAIPLEIAAVKQKGLRRAFFTGEGADMMFGSPAHERAEWILRLNRLPKWTLGALGAMPPFMFKIPRLGGILESLQRLHTRYGSVEGYGVKGHLFSTEIVGPDFEANIPAHIEELARRIANWPADLQTTFIILLGLAYNWNERFEKIAAPSQIDMFHPFQTHEMLALSMQMPMSKKVKNHIGKPLLRKIVGDRLSPEVPDRRKIQLSAPMWSWWNESSDLRDAVLQLRDPVSPVREYLDEPAMDAALKEYETGEVDSARLSRMLFIMLGLDLWLKMFMESEAPRQLDMSSSLV